MWADVPRDAVIAEWEPSLRRYPGEVIGRAIEALKASGREWPPELPVFMALCRQYSLPEHSPAALEAAKRIDEKRRLEGPNKKRAMPDMKGIFRTKGDKDWALKHKKRLEAGEKYLNPAQRRMVYDALRATDPLNITDPRLGNHPDAR